MSRNGYYIVSEEQATILGMLGFSVESLGGLLCLQETATVNWDAVTDALDDLVWEDGDVTEQEGDWLDAMQEYQNYLFWSTEVGWVP